MLVSLQLLISDIRRRPTSKANPHPLSAPSLPLAALTLALAFLLSSISLSASAIPLESLKPTEGQVKTTREVLLQLRERHYNDLNLDDELSERFLENYLDKLDPGKTIFFVSDVEEFRNYKTKFDDDLKTGKLQKGFDIYNRYRGRLVLRLEAVIARLENDELTYDFTDDDYLPIDPEDTEWAVDQATANQLWHKRVKSQLLNLVLADKPLDEARELLIKRYKDQLRYIEQRNTTDAYELMVNSLTELYDPHTNYLAPRTLENFNINMSLSLEGIGAVLTTENEYTKVDRIVTKGPADKQGQLRPADRIVAVGQDEEGEMVDVIGWRLDEVVNLIRGPRNTVVRLDVLAPNSETKTISIIRDTVKLEDQAARSSVFELTDGSQLFKVGVIDLPAFYIDFDAYRRRDPNYKSTTRDVYQLLGELEEQNVDGIILDLRDNGGGSLQEATQLTDLFIDPGPVVQIRQSNQIIARGNQSRQMAKYRKPLVVLINRLSASASEIFAGAIQDYQRGLIVGNQSFGKGTVQSLTPLSEGQIKITESKFYRVSGDSTQHRGVIPDVVYPDMIDTDLVGESSYENALPWDQIRPVPHDTIFNFGSLVPLLQSQHDQRAAGDPDFTYLIDQQALIKEASDRKVISLNEKTRRAEQQAIENKTLAIENKRRKAKGLPTYPTVKAMHDAESTDGDETGEEVAASSEPADIDPTKDPILNETGYVLVDLIKMMEGDRVERVANF
jgi:carboxyl-terminal processing protease